MSKQLAGSGGLRRKWWWFLLCLKTSYQQSFSGICPGAYSCDLVEKKDASHRGGDSYDPDMEFSINDTHRATAALRVCGEDPSLQVWLKAL